MSHLSSDQRQGKIPRTILCLVIGYSFFRSFIPILSYTVPYMVQVKGLTNFQITNKLVPVGYYAAFVFVLLAAPACEFMSYKTIFVLGSFATLLENLLLRFGTSLFPLQLMEIARAFWTGASYYVFQAYLFFLVSENHFQTMTGFSQASGCVAVFLSSELGQILVSSGVSYNAILYVTIAAVSINCVLAFWLPKEESQREQQLILNFFSREQGFWSTIKETWLDKRLQLLSLWWAFALAGFELSLNYATVLFEYIDSASTYNGQVMAAGTALSVLMALSSVYLRRPVARLGGFFYIFGTLAYGIICLKLGYTQALWVAYTLYILLLGIEKLVICFVYAQCGSLIKNDRYALMFSFNSAAGQAITAALQAIIEAAKLDIVAQYKVLGSFFLVVAVVFSALYAAYFWQTHSLALISLEDLDMPTKLSKVEPIDEPLLVAETGDV